jgi:hypothetical protein
MQFMLLLYGDPALDANATPDEREASLNAHMAFARALRDAGAMAGGDELQAPATARTVRLDVNAPPVISDGPFAETREQLGGYYLIDAKDMDEALKWAVQVPAPGWAIEVRPVSTYS